MAAEWLKNNAIAIVVAIGSCLGTYTAVVTSVANDRQVITQLSADNDKMQDRVARLEANERDLQLQLSIVKTSQSASSETIVKIASTQDKLYESVNLLNQAIAKLSAKMEYIKQ